MITTPQSANPGHGGLLPGVKVADRVEHLRDQVRPGPRPGFDTLVGLLRFVDRLRALANGKPEEFKL